eukprot:4398094-Pyramimonas_sp.AAC.1
MGRTAFQWSFTPPSENRCLHCDITFDTIEQYNDHVTSHHLPRPPPVAAFPRERGAGPTAPRTGLAARGDRD